MKPRFHNRSPGLLVIVAILMLAPPNLPAAASLDRIRFIIETDAGGDPDDEQSLVRFLLYANEWDLEGIIANRAAAREIENLNRERTGLGIVRQLVRAYGLCWTNLVQHDPRYPIHEQLSARSVAGYDDTDAGVNLIIAAVDRDDPRPVWYADWGSDRGSGIVNMKRALDRVLSERGENGYARFKNKIRLIGYDQFPDHTARMPDWKLWVNTFQPPMDGKRWYHRFSALTAKAGGFDLVRDCLNGHGPLGALYPTNTTHVQKEGDSPTFLYLIPTGMNDPDEPSWGSWAGRYDLIENHPGKPYFWANQQDHWHGTTSRDNTLLRWAAALQNDFRARLDWCVNPPTAANHPPQVILNGVEGTAVLRLHASPGMSLKLDASATRDPDGHSLQYEWFNYTEAGSYRGALQIAGGFSPVCMLTVPADADGKELHLVVEVTDTGAPPLTRYRRAVIQVSSPASASAKLTPFFQPPREWAGEFGAFRSPLLFDSGSAVRAAEEWPRRRAEISETWHTLMGSWPRVLTTPKLAIVSETPRDNFTQKRVTVEIAAGQISPGWLLVPRGPGPFPAALVVYYEPETSVGLNPDQSHRDFGLQLARRGFVTLSIGTPGGNAWKPEIGTASCQPLSYHAYVAANCWHALANLPEVDRTRIGVAGHSYGGKWAMFAAALWDKFATVAVSDPGIVFDETRPNVNYWEPWYLGFDPAQPRPKPGLPSADNPRTGAYRKMIETGHDLHELHALIAPRPFFVSGGAEDPLERWRALNHLTAINNLLGVTNRVAMTRRAGHSPTAESNDQLYAFFEHFLGNRPHSESKQE